MRRLLTLLVLLAATASLSFTAESTLIHFEIEDQFDQVHTGAELAGRPLVLFGSDREGSRYSGRWVEVVRDALVTAGETDAVQIVEVADLRGVPFFVKGSVKKKFPRDPAGWVLLDWRGQLAQSYGFARDACSILLFDRDGRLTYRAAVTELDAKIVAKLMANVTALLPEMDESSRKPDEPKE